MSISLLLAALVRCVAGCNSGSPDEQALHVLECDTETGASRIVQSVKGVQGTTYFAFDDVGADGSLKLRNVAKLRGSFPRDFELMPGEKFMVVGHKMSNEIQVYRFDRAACTLEPVGDPISCWRPLCFKFGK